MKDLREAVMQSLAFTMRDFATVRDFEAARAKLRDNLRAALDFDTGETTTMHTPGPWTVRHDFRSGNGELCIGVSAARIGPKSGAVAWPSGVDDAQELANARLIAAAPELLEALKEIVNAADGAGWEQLDPSFKKARAAIARATGDQ